MATSNDSIVERLQRAIPASARRGRGVVDRLSNQNDIGAAFFGQSEFDRSSGLPFMTRVKVDVSDTPSEKRQAFLNDYPEGAFERVPVTGELVFRFNAQDETEPYKTIERDVPLELTPENVARETLEFGKDVTEFMLNTAGPIAGEAVAALATRGRSILSRLLAVGAGAAAGEVVQEGAERALIGGDESAGQVAVRSGVTGIMAPAGFAAGAGVTRLVQGARGRGFLSTSPEAREAMQAIERINATLQQSGSDIRVPQLSVGQAAEAPIFRRIEEQSAALTAPVRRQRQAQVQAVQDMLDAAVDQRAIEQGRKALTQTYDDATAKLTATMQNPRVVLSQGGKALEDGISQWDESAKIAVDGLYELARKIGEPLFDLGSAVKGTGLQAAAAAELRGIPAGVSRFSKEERKQLLDIGIPASAFARRKIQAAPPDQDVAAIAAEMLLADPATVGVDVLRAWRTRLWDIKQVPTGQLAGPRQYQAGRLFTAVNRVLDTPSNANPRFVQAWKAANERARGRFDTLEKAVVARIVRSGDMTSGETIEQLAATLQSPQNASNLRFLKKLVPNQAYERFRDSFKTRLLNSPEQITESLNLFDHETLGLLLSPAERSAIRGFAEAFDMLNSTGVAQQLRAQAQPRQFLRGLIERNDTAGVAQLNQLITMAGGRASPPGRAIRYALLDHAFDKFVIDTDIQQLSHVAIRTFEQDLQRLGLAGFLTKQDRRLIRELRSIAPFFRFSRGGAGASIQAAEAASGVVEGTPSAIYELIEKAGAGRILVNPRVRAFLLGRPGSQPMDTDFINMMGAAAMTALVRSAETSDAVQALNQITEE